MGRTSIPCDAEVRDRLSNDKPEDMSWDEYLTVLHSDQEIVMESNSSNSSNEDIAELSDQMDRLRRELDELGYDVNKIREALESS